MQEYGDNIILPPPQFRDEYKPVPMQRTDLQKITTNDLFNFDHEIFQKEKARLKNIKIIKKNNDQNKKFNSFTNEFKIKILKSSDDVKEIYLIFQEIIKTAKRKQKLNGNDRLRFIIQNEELPSTMSIKFQKVKHFRVADFEEII